MIPLIVVLIAALILAVAFLAILALAAVGPHREPDRWLPVQAAGLLARLARRILGLHVRKPSPHVPEQRPRETAGAGERR